MLPLGFFAARTCYELSIPRAAVLHYDTGPFARPERRGLGLVLGSLGTQGARASTPQDVVQRTRSYVPIIPACRRLRHSSSSSATQRVFCDCEGKPRDDTGALNLSPQVWGGLLTWRVVSTHMEVSRIALTIPSTKKCRYRYTSSHTYCMYV